MRCGVCARNKVHVVAAVPAVLCHSFHSFVPSPLGCDFSPILCVSGRMWKASPPSKLTRTIPCTEVKLFPHPLGSILLCFQRGTMRTGTGKRWWTYHKPINRHYSINGRIIKKASKITCFHVFLSPRKRDRMGSRTSGSSGTTQRTALMWSWEIVVLWVLRTHGDKVYEFLRLNVCLDLLGKLFYNAGLSFISEKWYCRSF